MNQKIDGMVCDFFWGRSFISQSLTNIQGKRLGLPNIAYDEESDHSNKAVRKTPEIESGHKVSEEVKWT